VELYSGDLSSAVDSYFLLPSVIPLNSLEAYLLQEGFLLLFPESKEEGGKRKRRAKRKEKERA